MVRVFRFLKFAWSILKYNIGTLLVFEIIYKLATIAVFRPVLMGLWRLSLRVRGLSFLSDETVGIYLKGPAIWIILFLLILCLTFFTLLDICCIIICLHAAYRHQKMPLLALIRKGSLEALKIFRRKNWLMILYLLIIIPVTHVVLIRGYVAKFQVPEFIFDYIRSHGLLFFVYIAFWVYMGYRSFHWIYSMHYFCLEDCTFGEARRKSIHLLGKNFWKDIAAIVVWNAVLIGVYYGIVLGAAYLISAFNQAFVSSDFVSSLTLSGMTILLGIMGLLYFFFCMPAVYLCITMLYYYRKATQKEEIPKGYTDLDEAYRLQDTVWARKLYEHRRQLIALAAAVALAVNFAYMFAEKKGVAEFSIGDQIEVTAHRGYSEYYPENTMPAFQGAVRIGADCIELDVQQTKDGKIIVMHDSNLKRTTGVDRNIWETDYKDLRFLDAGSWFDKKFTDTQIPTLEEVLKYTKGKIRLNIELKPTGHETDFEQHVVDLVKQQHCEKNVVLSSMKYECLENIKQIDPDIQTVYITSVSLGNFNVLDDADGYSVEASMLTQKFVNQAHRAGREVLVWTVNSEDSMERVLQMGVDGIITDRPADAQRLIYRMNHSSFWDRYVERLLRLQ